MKQPLKLLSICLLFALTLLAACNTTTTPEEAVTDDIAVIASNNADLSILVEALGKAELVDALKGEGPFTVFAPSNAAFTALLTELELTKEELFERADLADILKYHVISGQSLMADDLKEPNTRITLQGATLTHTEKDGSIIINDRSTVTTPNVAASNGVIHLLDRVLLPPSPEPPALDSIIQLAEKTADLSVLLEAIQVANLSTVLEASGPLTVFAPTNTAFTVLLEELKITKETLLQRDDLADILKYHIIDAQKLDSATLIAQSPGDVGSLQGEKITHAVVDGALILNESAKVSTPDLDASNGVVHLLDTVLLPPSIATSAPKTLTEVAASLPELSTLVAALQATGLDIALSGEGPFTVFAPSNAAFTALIEATDGVTNLEELVATLGADAVSDLLKYHVVADARLLAADVIVTAPNLVTSLQGDGIFYEILDGKVTLNGLSTVTSPDGEASNGVIHVVNTVLAIPESKTYALDEVDSSGVSGTITFTRKSDNTTLVSMELSGTTGGFTHPAHIHVGDLADGGAIYAFLPFVDGTTGIALGTVSQTNAGADLNYDDLIAYDGYVNIHAGKAGATPSDQGDLSVVATGEVGTNSTSYTLSEVDESGVSGTITFSENDDGTTLVSISLDNTIAANQHPAHIHVGSASTPAGIYLFLPFVNGATGQALGTVTETNAAEAITYDDIIAYDGYVNIHLGKEDATPGDQGDLAVVATGEVGTGATTITLP